MQVWEGDHFENASESSPQASSSSSEEEDSQQAEDDNGDSEHDSDMNNFLANDDDEEALAPAGSSDFGNAEDEYAEKESSAHKVSAMLKGAGMATHRADKEHFSIYIQYLVLDLVDSTFAVRVRSNNEYREYFDSAVRHVEESLAFKRWAFLDSFA